MGGPPGTGDPAFTGGGNDRAVGGTVAGAGAEVAVGAEEGGGSGAELGGLAALVRGGDAVTTGTGGASSAELEPERSGPADWPVDPVKSQAAAAAHVAATIPPITSGKPTPPLPDREKPVAPHADAVFAAGGAEPRLGRAGRAPDSDATTKGRVGGSCTTAVERGRGAIAGT